MQLNFNFTSGEIHTVLMHWLLHHALLSTDKNSGEDATSAILVAKVHHYCWMNMDILTVVKWAQWSSLYEHLSYFQLVVTMNHAEYVTN